MNSPDYAHLLASIQPRSITSDQDAERVQQQIDALIDKGDLVGPVFATKSIASEVLSGKRRLTTDHVMRLARFLHVAPGVFFPG